MSEEMKAFLESDVEAKAFDLFRRGKKIPVSMIFIIGMKSLFGGTIYWLIKGFPGPFGMKIRGIYYKMRFRSMGENCLIEEGVRVEGSGNIQLADYVFIDKDVSLFARFGSIEIGRRVHVAPQSYISGAGGVFIGDYVGISPGVKIFSHSESPRDGKRMSGPMMPEEFEGQVIKPVRIEKDAFLGANAIILPGVTVGEGAVVAANSLVIKNVAPYDIVMGVPAKTLGRRKKVTVPDV